MGKVFAVIGALALAVAAGAWLLDAGMLNLSLRELESRYAAPDSRFLDVDGVRVHYMDQGEGPAVLLLHASFMQLRTWDSMAAHLADRYRVVRPDLLISGLTGPEPDNDYSFDRSRELVIALMDELFIDHFAVVGTSSGGIVAFNLAADYPDRVSRLVLINSAGMPRTTATDPDRARRRGIDNWIRSRYQTRDMVRGVLDLNFIEPHEPPGWLVDMSYDFWRRDGGREAAATQMRNFRTGDPQTTLARVTSPTLILWGLDNATVMHLEADVFQHWLVNAPTSLKKYPGVGHYLYLEIPKQVETDVGQFLDGDLDSQLILVERRNVEPGRTPGTRFRDCDICPEMVVIPPGSFDMGFDGGEPERYEGPVRRINIPRAFAAGRTEVTVSQYRDFVTASGYQVARGCYAWDGITAELMAEASWEDPGYQRALLPNEPVVCLDWTDAQAYVEWLADLTGKPYRLLTEAEWEFAADAGSDKTFPWGDDPDKACLHANVYDLDAVDGSTDSALTSVNCRDGNAAAAPVGGYPPNAFGLNDMVGNVWEWTADCYVMPYPPQPLDGSAVMVDDCDRRSVKGGSWITRVERQRPTFRGRDPENFVSRVFGFRVARDL